LTIDIWGDFSKMTKFMALAVGVGSFGGTILGSYIPSLWGEDSLSVMGIVFSVIGAIVGILLGYQLVKRLGLS
jgi:uncharacterized membrane protein YeaQ/YmgE (transglycosylase-associated protein family)